MSEFGRVVSIAIATLLVVLGSAVAARAEKRVALVIGNIEYQYVPRLNTAVNDARIIAREMSQHVKNVFRICVDGACKLFGSSSLTVEFLTHLSLDLQQLCRRLFPEPRGCNPPATACRR